MTTNDIPYDPADQIHIDKINDMISMQKIIDDELANNTYKDIITEKNDNTYKDITNFKNDNSITLSSENNRESIAPLGLTLVTKATYNNTLPAWFTLPSNAINPIITVNGGGGGGGGANSTLWGNSGGGGGGGESIFDFPLNPGDTIYSVLGAGGIGGKGVVYELIAGNGGNGGTTIVEGSANFPLGGLRALGGRGGEGARTDRVAYGGQWIMGSSPYSIAGQSGGHGGTRALPHIYAQNGYPCYSVPGGKSGGSAMNLLYLFHGGGGGGASAVKGNGGNGGTRNQYMGKDGSDGINGGGGGGAASGCSISDNGNYYVNGGNGGKGWVHVQYYI